MTKLLRVLVVPSFLSSARTKPIGKAVRLAIAVMMVFGVLASVLPSVPARAANLSYTTQIYNNGQPKQVTPTPLSFGPVSSTSVWAAGAVTVTVAGPIAEGYNPATGTPWPAGGGITVTASTVAVAGGVLSGSFTIADSPQGIYTVTLTSAGGDTATLNIAVLAAGEPLLTFLPVNFTFLNPASQNVGDTVQLSGTGTGGGAGAGGAGWGASEPIVVRMHSSTPISTTWPPSNTATGGGPSTGPVVASVLTTQSGGANSFGASFIVPERAGGLYWVLFQGSPNNGLGILQVNLYATRSPSSGPAGTSVTVNVTGAGKNVSGYTIRIVDPNSTTTDFAGVRVRTMASGLVSSSSGRFTATFAMPSISTGSLPGGKSGIRIYDPTDAIVFPPQAGPLYGAVTLDFAYTAQLALSPTSGPMGALVALSASGLSLPYTGYWGDIQIWMDGTTQLETIPSQLIVSSTGLLSGIARIPVQGVSNGPHEIQVRYNGIWTVFAAASFTVDPAAAVASVMPPAGTPGAKISVTGSNFNANSAITIKFDGEVRPSTPAVLTTDAGGSFAGSITVPSRADGNYTVLVTDAIGKPASALFTLNNGTGSLTLSPSSGVGATTASATGLTYGSPVTVTFDGKPAPTYPDQPVVTGTSAFPSLKIFVSLPTVTPGQYEIDVIDVTGKTARATFTVPSMAAGTTDATPGAVAAVDAWTKFPITVLNDALDPVAGATVYLINNGAGTTVQTGVTNAAGLLIMTSPVVSASTLYRIEATAGSVISPKRLVVSPSSALPLQAEVTMTNSNAGDAGAGPAYVGGKVSRFIDIATGQTTTIADGIGAFDATVTYDPAGVSVKAASGLGAFAPMTATLDAAGGTRTNVNGYQTGATPQAPVELFRLYPWLTGRKDIPYNITFHFNTLTRVSGGEVPPVADVVKTFLRGDANNDSKVTITDALFIAQYLAGMRGLGDSSMQVNPVNAATPMNDSATTGSTITIQDALVVAQMLAGLRDASYNLI